MFDLRHLRHAVALAEHRHFAHAAKAQNISQPALSRSIQTLEESLGVRLFDRDRYSVEPTFYGQVLLQGAADLMLAARDLQREVEMAKGLQEGELKIGIGPWGASALIGRVIGQLSLRHPALRITTVVAPWKELPARLHAREIDLLVTHTSEVQLDERLTLQPLRDHPHFLLCRPGHPILQRPQASLDDVLDFPMAAPELPNQVLEGFLERIKPTARAAVRRRGLLSITCDSSSVLKDIVLHSWRWTNCAMGNCWPCHTLKCWARESLAWCG